ncbi:ferredoxin [Solicola gregarius]|uniref:Ferredoxin n=1 Tax=Solicola gregarius TaxID=2908642 RepID=A0AA46THG9_9ACTN|nr:ferredoxin [Solicola gregarius]UYM04907.1 ferredoxin [Solicola gregarius]
MKVSVDRSVCQNHGQCAIAAPEVFDIADDGELVYEPEPSDEFEADVEDAADVCPVQAILVGSAG